VGCTSGQTTWNGRVVRTAACTSLAAARISLSGAGLGALVEPDWVKAAQALVQQGCSSSFGGPNAYGYGLLAGGCCDVLCDASDNEIYDICAGIAIVAGAGGRVFSYDGTPVDQGAKLDLECVTRTYGLVAVGDVALVPLLVPALSGCAWLV
jgi:fructose-1,6-bisphosphatase/inositol monophosphatase family enzyme